MPGDEVVEVLVVTHLEEDFLSLGHVFSHSNWKLNWVRNCEEARRAIGEQLLPVVLCEDRLPDGNWKEILGELERLSHPPRLIVVSHAADEHLWAEVLDRGGYDVLSKPFDRTEVVRAISLAWRQWKHDVQARGKEAGC